jgi:hypothetical protein
MAKKKVWFVIGRSAFGDYWVGKTNKRLPKKQQFNSFEDATEAAIEMTDSVSNRDELEAAVPEECEIVRKAMERWLI